MALALPPLVGVFHRTAESAIGRPEWSRDQATRRPRVEEVEPRVVANRVREWGESRMVSPRKDDGSARGGRSEWEDECCRYGGSGDVVKTSTNCAARRFRL